MFKTLYKIRDELSKKIGEEVILTKYEPRNRIIKHTGILTKIYPSLFIIDLGDASNTVNRVSFRYSDILTGDIELIFN